MRFVVIDYETFFTDQKDDRDRPYTLTRLSTEDYIRHPWFEAHGAAIKWSADHEARWYDARILRQVLKEEDWSDVFLIAWHAQFDAAILNWHYGVRPKMLGCPMSMARMCIGTHVSVALDSVRKHFNLPLKTTPYNLFKGKHWNQLSPQEQQMVADGCCDEVESIWLVFCRLMRGEY